MADPSPVCIRSRRYGRRIGRDSGRYGCKPIVLGLVLVVAAGCTSSGSPAPAPSVTGTRTVIETRTPSAPPPFTPAPAASVRPLPPGAHPQRGETAKACPYVKAGLDQEPTTGANVADIEGDHVYRTTVLTALHPIGCRFYFYAPPYEAIADIQPRTFATATAAHNAMVLTARAGGQEIAEPAFVPGVDGIRFQTRFFGPDGRKDWAFAFAKGRVLVVVHTQQTNASLNAQLLAQAVVDRF
jgi:hypothetical protein